MVALLMAGKLYMSGALGKSIVITNHNSLEVHEKWQNATIYFAEVCSTLSPLIRGDFRSEVTIKLYEACCHYYITYCKLYS